jgi:tetratricopeptide (TPR) repeat protein
LWSERKVEQDFVENALKNEKAPKGWPAALLMFHFGMWRERLRNDLTALAEERTPAGPPALDSIDEFNDAELASGIGTPLADAAARSDHLLAEIIGLYEKLGERPYTWYRWSTTTDAVLGNSYTHPRIHLYQYLRENGDVDRAEALLEEAAKTMREVSTNPLVHATAAYNLACVRARQGKLDEAIDNLAEAFKARPEMKESAAKDSDLVQLHGDERFRELVKS